MVKCRRSSEACCILATCCVGRHHPSHLMLAPVAATLAVATVAHETTVAATMPSSCYCTLSRPAWSRTTTLHPTSVPDLPSCPPAPHPRRASDFGLMKTSPEEVNGRTYERIVGFAEKPKGSALEAMRVSRAGCVGR